ncbi:DUF6233 domain-containing protein [Streptomyces sp. CA-256286]|uniref:DUF6233 domain-containing protein n=1 Tax=Streptomyces sp. CA-256286 TaxID=2801033 RepID=UPI001F61E0BC|nr:DUF6233 domain-containing protein [Streptomyces sp. CA-256286]
MADHPGLPRLTAAAGRAAGPHAGGAGGRSRRARAEQLWKIEPQRPGSVTLLHRGYCGLFDNAGALIDRETALAALREPDVAPCPLCAPETGLIEQ